MANGDRDQVRIHGQPPRPATIRNVGNVDGQFIQIARVGVVVGSIRQEMYADGYPHGMSSSTHLARNGR